MAGRHTWGCKEDGRRYDVLRNQNSVYGNYVGKCVAVNRDAVERFGQWARQEEEWDAAVRISVLDDEVEVSRGLRWKEAVLTLSSVAFCWLTRRGLRF